jgi:hypothetical protein
MSLISRFLGAFLLTAAVLVTVASLSAEWIFEACMVTDSSGNRVSLFEAHRKGEQLTRQAQAALERMNKKEKIAEMVISGEMSLIEGAAWFRAFHREPHAWHVPTCPPPGPKEGEGWCRVVVDWIDTYVRFHQSPSQAEAIRDRLEAELQTHLDHNGVIELPE